MKQVKFLILLSVLMLVAAMPVIAQDAEKPNILVIWGDDIGFWNVSYTNHGMMGYKTPNIDRIANEGLAFTDYYGEQSCTAGRSSFITGQIPVRTGLTKVGMPGAPQGLHAKDPTIAELLKPLGYMTGQFGKNHLGDGTSICRPIMALTNSSVISITSISKRNRNYPTTRPIRNCSKRSLHAVSSGRLRTASSKTPVR